MKNLEIQSLLFSRDKWTPAKAAKWLKDHKYKTPPVEETIDYLRYRQAPPLDFQKGTFVTKEFSKTQGIKAIMAKSKKAKSNPPKKSIVKIPLTLVELGECLSITLDDEKEIKFKKTWLFANEIGNMLFIIPKTKTKKTQLPEAQKKAIRLYETWTEFDSDSAYEFKLPKIILWRTDDKQAIEIVYRSDKWSETRKKTDYVHEFETPCRIDQGYAGSKAEPAIQILRSSFKITKKGIEG